MNDVDFDLCIYHADCLDGFAAAWAVRQCLPTIELLAAQYGDVPPDVTGRKVVIVDFSYKRGTLLAMAEQADRILVLDHHKTALEDLTGIHNQSNKIQTLFNMDRSGAELAWLWFHSDRPPPALLMHVADRDLWNFNLANTKEVCAALSSFPMDMDTWDLLMFSDVETMILEGRGILRKQLKDIEDLIDGGHVYPLRIDDSTIPAMVLPPMLASEAGNRLAQHPPYVAAIIYPTKADPTTGGLKVSLRSTAEGPDVADIAKLFGGGGHARAAGFVARDYGLITQLFPAATAEHTDANPA